MTDNNTSASNYQELTLEEYVKKLSLFSGFTPIESSGEDNSSSEDIQFIANSSLFFCLYGLDDVGDEVPVKDYDSSKEFCLEDALIETSIDKLYPDFTKIIIHFDKEKENGIISYTNLKKLVTLFNTEKNNSLKDVNSVIPVLKFMLAAREEHTVMLCVNPVYIHFFPNTIEFIFPIEQTSFISA